MPYTPEAKVKAKIKVILKEHGVYYAMPIGSVYGNSGVPDFLCCVNGHFFAIEAKAGKGVATALQIKNMQQIIDANGLAMVVREDNLDKLEERIKLLKGGNE